MFGVVAEIVTTGAFGVATLKTASVILSSLSNVVLGSVGSVVFPSPSLAVKFPYEKVLPPVATSVVMPDFLKMVVFPSASQPLLARTSVEVSQRLVRSAVTVHPSILVHPL